MTSITTRSRGARHSAVGDQGWTIAGMAATLTVVLASIVTMCAAIVETQTTVGSGGLPYSVLVLVPAIFFLALGTFEGQRGLVSLGVLLLAIGILVATRDVSGLLAGAAHVGFVLHLVGVVTAADLSFTTRRALFVAEETTRGAIRSVTIATILGVVPAGAVIGIVQLGDWPAWMLVAAVSVLGVGAVGLWIMSARAGRTWAKKHSTGEGDESPSPAKASPAR